MAFAPALDTSCTFHRPTLRSIWQIVVCGSLDREIPRPGRTEAIAIPQRGVKNTSLGSRTHGSPLQRRQNTLGKLLRTKLRFADSHLRNMLTAATASLEKYGWQVILSSVFRVLPASIAYSSWIDLGSIKGHTCCINTFQEYLRNGFRGGEPWLRQAWGWRIKTYMECLMA
jgi:hypothetical protein